jgi:LCP family protein required for cell wall assembly
LKINNHIIVNVHADNFFYGVIQELKTGVHGFSVKANNSKAMDAGFQLLDNTVEEIIGMNIDYNVIVNFQAFKQAVCDTVGGVDVNVPTDLVDPTMAWENADNPVLAKAGPQVFDGKQALIYVRSRETTSVILLDQDEQRALLLALKDKTSTVETLSNPMKISGLIKTFGDNLYTDLSLNNATRLYTIIQKTSDMDVKTIGLTDPSNPLLNTGNVNGQSIVLPKKGLFKYTEIQNFLKSQIISPFVLKEQARVMLLNGTGVPGLATAKADALRKAGYNIVGTANTPQSGYSQTLLIDINGKNKRFTKKLLEQNLKVQAQNKMPDDTIATSNADFVIILGSNETINPKVQTN